MSNRYFAFKQFTVFHDRCAMKVGTDGVLLGAWTDIGRTGRILDIGTGSGLIAIMLAQRSDATADAVEIDRQAADQARENVLASPWSKRISVYANDIRQFSEGTNKRYDLVVSNPPFFRNSLKPPAGSRSMAKHDVGLTYDSLLAVTSGLLNPGGRFCVIIPSMDKVYFCAQAEFYTFFPQHVTWVKPFPEKRPLRCLIDFNHEKKSGTKEDELAIRDLDGEFSSAYKILTKDFYLKF